MDFFLGRIRWGVAMLVPCEHALHSQRFLGYMKM
jgi:hypothetical protein